MSSPTDPLDDVALASVSQHALEFADARRRDGPLGTADLLLGVLDADVSDGWQSVQLRTNYVDAESAIGFPDGDEADEAGGTWRGTPLTPMAAVGLAAAVRIAGEFDLVPVPTGALALGLLADPRTGAARMLLDDSTIDHDELIELVQDEVLGMSLEGLDLDDVLRRAKSKGRRRFVGKVVLGGGKPRPNVKSPEWGISSGTGLGVLIGTVEGDLPEGFREVLESMLLDKESIEMAAQGTADLEDEPLGTVLDRAKSRFDTEAPDASALIASVAIGASPRISEVLRRLGLTPNEVAAQMAEEHLALVNPKKVSRNVFAASVLNGLVCVVISLLIVLDAIGGFGSLWKLLLVIPVWYGYPQSGPVVGVVIAGFLGWIVSPLVGALQLFSLVTDRIQAGAERRDQLARTGVSVSVSEQRRLTMRKLNARARKSQRSRQRGTATLRAYREGRTED